MTIEVNSFTFAAEYITALDDFEPVVVNRSVELTGPKPNAVALELSYLVSSKWLVAARYEAANDFQDDPRRWGMVVSYGLFENAALGLEYLCRDTASPIDNSSHMVTARLAVAF